MENNHLTPPSMPVTLPALSLPKGGGALQGMMGSLAAVNATGGAGFTLPLPISPGRGYAPKLALNYHSSNGNSPFGLGWQLSGVSAISRCTQQGTPRYHADDEFLDPKGEVLVPECDQAGQVKITTENHFRGIALAHRYHVQRFFPRVESDFNRIECWTQIDSQAAPFWLLHSADGCVHLYGINELGRVADPEKPESHVARWLIQESLDPHGQHIVYHYRSEDQQNLDLSTHEAARDHQASLYLTCISYANVDWCDRLYLLPYLLPKTTLVVDIFSATDFWHCQLCFDYADNAADNADSSTVKTWEARPDPFSDYAFGFEIRTHRLCHQVSLLHQFANSPEVAQPTAISRLRLSYDKNPIASRLISAQKCSVAMASSSQTEENNSLPPILFDYSTFDSQAAFSASRYMRFDAMSALTLNLNHPYQLVDLYGEGVPGILYRDDSHWRYRPAERGVPHTEGAEQSDQQQEQNVAEDSIVYGSWQLLSSQPPRRSVTSTVSPLLADITGNSCLQWISTQPGISGFFTLNSDRHWSSFTPFAAFPCEFLHPNAQFADLMGKGRVDMVLIGSKSVRLYANEGRQGYRPAVRVAHQQEPLPIPASNAEELVAFSDILGSGQQHLVRIRHNLIECWPNLGLGRFGKKITLGSLPFARHHFNPQRLFLADIDGSGTTDLIYAQTDRFRIFHNQSGNQLVEIAALPMPEGVRYNHLTQVSFVDVAARGCSSLILTLLQPRPRHWRYDLVQHKPYLLNKINNQTGGITCLSYRSSAQEWLDEKGEKKLAEEQPQLGAIGLTESPFSIKSPLPFPLQLLKQVTHQDEISGNQLTQAYQYRQGFFDAIERNFIGFGLILQTDKPSLAAPTEQGGSLPTPSILRKTWYHSGQQNNNAPDVGYDNHDPLAMKLADTQLTRFDASTAYDAVLNNVDNATKQDMWRALRGAVRRCEIFGLTADDKAVYPYSVSEIRYRLRQLQPKHHQRYGVTLCLPLETRQYQYERLMSDPRTDHQINLHWDRYGYLTHSLQIHYSRRADASLTQQDPHYAYWQQSFDDGQKIVRLEENQACWQHITKDQEWRLGLPQETRSDQREWSQDQWKKYLNSPTGCCYETFIEPAGSKAENSPLSSTSASVILAYQRYYYVHDLPAEEQKKHSDTDCNALEALFAYSESAVLDAISLQAYADYIADDALESELIAGKYHLLPVSRLLPQASAATLWGKREHLCRYSQPEQFRKLMAYQANLSVGNSTFIYDDYHCLPMSCRNALGNKIHVNYNYRYLLPSRIMDENENTDEAHYDTLGRLVTHRFYGREEGKPVGFISPALPPMTALTLEQAIADPKAALQKQATRYLYDTWAWQKNRQPVSSLVIVSDRYPDDAEVQIRLQLIYFDGLGRTLQNKQKTTAGLAWQATTSGGLVCSGSQPTSLLTQTRWRVSGRVEYDHKGLIIRRYQPYFLDTHRYINDEMVRAQDLCETCYYDTLGRMIKTKKANGYFKRNTYFAWFVMQEDENDTWHEVVTADLSS